MGVRAENMHLIGHSLGAQIVGSTARHYFNLTGKQIERITGLDPARPCFVGDAAYPRIGRGDAKYVDIIHSNPGDMGTEEVIGDADFYPGGLDTTKPGCSTISLTCSHERAIEYFSESIYPKNEQNFIGKLCNNFSDVEAKNCNVPTSPMGFAANANFKGIYYVDVREQSPFGSNAATNALVEFEKCGLCS